jgi:hypothetical protein
MAAEETTAPLNHFPEAVSSELIRIADWLIMHNRDEYMNVYARVRATILLKSLQQLKEQQRSSSGGSIQGVPVANSPMVVSFIDFTGRNIFRVRLPTGTGDIVSSLMSRPAVGPAQRSVQWTLGLVPQE